MVLFLPDVEIISKCYGGISYAFKLVMYMSNRLFGEFEHESDSGAGESDVPYVKFDGLMVDLIKKRGRCSAEDWAEDACMRLEETSAKLYSFGMPPFFPRSIRLLQEIMQEVDRRFTGKDDNDDETADSEY
jgi:hypothetical protein